MTENNAQAILEVAKAIGAHFEMSELLASMNEVIRRGGTWAMELPQRHALAVKLLNQWHLHSP
jgi:hypothetical protein